MEFARPMTLRGRWVELVPLDPSHAAALRDAARDRDGLRYLLIDPGFFRGDLEGTIAAVLARQAAGHVVAFATTLLPERRPIGMTGFLDIDPATESVQIGGTWLDSRYWRTPVNTEAKWLMLRRAFDLEGAHRVWLQTDARNARSQAAIERLGAVREATLREDHLLPDGGFRDSVRYSILADEWPAIRDLLQGKLARPWTPGAG